MIFDYIDNSAYRYIYYIYICFNSTSLFLFITSYFFPPLKTKWYLYLH